MDNTVIKLIFNYYDWENYKKFQTKFIFGQLHKYYQLRLWNHLKIRHTLLNFPNQSQDITQIFQNILYFARFTVTTQSLQLPYGEQYSHTSSFTEINDMGNSILLKLCRFENHLKFADAMKKINIERKKRYE